MDNGDGASAASSPMSARSVGRARAGSASNKPPSTTMIGMKIQNQARELEEKRKQERKKGLMVLVLRYLSDNGYFNSADVLEEESGVSLQKYDAADNMDLLTILTEYEEYYELKFDKKPKFMRKIADDANHARSKTTGAVGGLKRRTSASSSNVNLPKINKARGASTPTPPSNYGNVDSYSSNISIISNNLSNGSGAVVSNNNSAAEKRKSSGGNDKKSSENNNVDDTSDNGSENNDGFGFDISGTKITTKKPPLASKDNKEAGLKQKPSGGPAARGTNNNNNNNVKKRISSADSRLQGNDNSGDEDDYYENRMLKPMPDFGFNNELRELAAIIQRDIIMETPNVHWNDISGLEKAKQLLKEAVVAPVKYPQFFTGLLKPWKGVLLFGPPGTGKTMLAKAVATECRTTFFNISASSIVSKWRGDSEKLVRILFELARHHRPSTIFLDELDAIMGQRDSSGTEHEGSRRLKTELLIQMDGLAKSTDLVFVLAASNLPWELDTAMLRRLEKRILVPLPGVEARQMMFQQYLVDSGAEEGRVAADIDCADLARRTEGYSGSDIVLVCKEAAMRPLRRMMKQLEDLNLNLDSLDYNNGGDADSELANATVKIEPVTKEDVDAALAATRPTAQKYLSKYSEWEKECGSSV